MHVSERKRILVIDIREATSEKNLKMFIKKWAKYVCVPVQEYI